MCVSVSVCPHKHLDTTRADTPVRAILFVCTMQDLCEHIVYMHRRTTQQRGEKLGRDNVDEVPRNDGDSVEDAKERKEKHLCQLAVLIAGTPGGMTKEGERKGRGSSRRNA